MQRAGCGRASSALPAHVTGGYRHWYCGATTHARRLRGPGWQDGPFAGNLPHRDGGGAGRRCHARGANRRKPCSIGVGKPRHSAGGGRRRAGHLVGRALVRPYRVGRALLGHGGHPSPSRYSAAAARHRHRRFRGHAGALVAGPVAPAGAGWPVALRQLLGAEGGKWLARPPVPPRDPGSRGRDGVC